MFSILICICCSSFCCSDCIRTRSASVVVVPTPFSNNTIFRFIPSNSGRFIPNAAVNVAAMFIISVCRSCISVICSTSCFCS